MGRRDVTVRMAKNEDGPAVAALMKKLDAFQWDDWEIDWSNLEPSWLVAEHGGAIVGCIQVLMARPLGRIECLAVNPDLSLMMRYVTTKALTDHAIATVYFGGADAVVSSIPNRHADYLHGAQNRGWCEIESGTLVIRRLH